MKSIRNLTIKLSLIAVLLTLSFIISPAKYVFPAVMEDYCVTPPFVVGGGVQPNLLLTIDNSSSMYDLAYIDNGKEDAGTFTRFPYYCYDQTYSSDNIYIGYFENGRCSNDNTITCLRDSECKAGTCVDIIYKYNKLSFNDGYFEPVPSIPDPFPAVCSHSIPEVDPDTLCVNIAGSDVTDFVATGSYLNWITSSKFDVQKKILTGGKYIDKACSLNSGKSCDTDAYCLANDWGNCDDIGTDFMLSESRGCVGRRFIKEPNKADFVNYDSPETNNTNEPLGVTFAVRGPGNPENAAAVRQGGQTYIDIYSGDYTQISCQEAIDLLTDPESQKQEITDAIDACLFVPATPKKQCQFETRVPAEDYYCKNDDDCLITAGTCGLGSGGICGVDTAGTCEVTTAGTCTGEDGDCSNNKQCIGGIDDGTPCNSPNDCDSGICSKVCLNAGKFGNTCNNDNNCDISTCSAGDVGSICIVDADCDVKNCSAGEIGDSCVVDQDCDVKSCSAPASRAGDPCAGDSDCNPNACTAGSPVNPGGFCTSDWDCSDTYGRCLPPASAQLNSTFSQSMHSCYQLTHKGAPLAQNEIQQVSNPAGCGLIYRDYKTCFGGVNDDRVCNADADCPSGSCENGPDYIPPGSPAYLCNSAYAGYCAETSNDWEDTIWVAREYSSADACVLAKYNEFCGALDIPPVIDPTDDASDTSEFSNLPAILADMGIGAQLSNPIATMPVKVKMDSEPTGLIQEFNNLIRMGTMTFNYNGSNAECGTAALPCPKACSISTNVTCTSVIDCPLGFAETCDPVILGTNLDGAQIIHYIGTPGECSVTTTDSCTSELDCPDGETCITVGDHTKGLVRSIDNIRADSWTPFSEAFYEAIGYFARTSAYDKPDPVKLTGTISTPITTTDCQADNGSGLSRDLRLNLDRDYCEDTNPSQYRCQGNNILIISDGMSTADQNSDVLNTISNVRLDGLDPAFPDDGEFDLVPGPTCNLYLGSRNLDDLAWIAQNRDITDFSVALDDGSDQSRRINTYAVFNGAASNEPGQCDPDTLLRDASETKGGGKYARAENPEQLNKALRELFELLAAKASSGTAASVLASGSGEGANLLQAIFYPKRFFGTSGDEADWIGTLQNLWYYVDPRFGASAIREDTDGDNTQHLIDDYVVSYAFRDDKTVVDLLEDVNGDNSSLVLQKTVDLEFLNNLWEAGTLLWQRDITAAAPAGARTIKTSIDGSTLIDFKNEAASITALMPYLQAADKAEAEAIIRFTHGEDTRCSVDTSVACSFAADCPVHSPPVIQTCGFIPAIANVPPGVPGNYRTRTVRIDLNNDDDVTDAGEEAKVWKLGDIINSTPKVLSWVPINTYFTRYGDNTYKKFTCSDPFSAPCTSGYDDRGLIFTSANDGMLHAFKLGKLELDWAGRGPLEFSRLTNLDPTTPLGHEQWAFIPKNALPYLKYAGDPGYCHLYIDDGSPVITDASIGGLPTAARPSNGSSWRTVLIGSMRYGGACRESNAPPCVDCVNAPGVDINGDGDKDDTIGGIVEAEQGFSSYFALDITNPENPTFMWEFTDPALGYSTPGVSFVRINAEDAANPGDPVQYTNGDWFAVIPSGPTGPIDKTTKQFLARSDQNLKLFVLDLKTGAKKATIDLFNGAAIPNAFGGSSLNAALDYDNDYQDDILYIPYITKNAVPIAGYGNDQWTDGGIVRVYTDVNDPSTANDPTTWTASRLIDGIGAVSSAVDELKNKTTGKLWLFFGTGRYFFKKGKVLDDSISQRRIFGIKEPCFDVDIDTNCVDSFVQAADGSIARSDDATIKLVNVTDLATDPPDTDDPGWYIDLALKDLDFDAERVTTDPVATSSQVVFFTTFRPSSDICSYGGNSHLWGVKYDTGGCADDYLQGKALIQVSTGTIEQIDLKAFLSCPDPDNPPPPPPPGDEVIIPRRSPKFTGKPPEGPGLILITAPPPEERFMHIRER